MKPQDFADQLEACAGRKVSLADFEDWFERNSWDAHKQSDSNLTKTVFRVESLLSARDDNRLSDADLMTRLKELAKAIRPFVHTLPVIPLSWTDPKAKRVEYKSESVSGVHLTFRNAPAPPTLRPKAAFRRVALAV